MAQRASQHEQDEVTWSTAAVRLGKMGLDLRGPGDPDVLQDLLNARFLDEETVERRNGHLGQVVQDGDNFPAVQPVVAGDWLYGHGHRVADAYFHDHENLHWPIHRVGRATFRLEGTDVVWTGDRLLIPQELGPALGSSEYWWRGPDAGASKPQGTIYKRGIPAFLPVQTDVFPPATVKPGSETQVGSASARGCVGTALTTTLRGYVHVENAKVVAHVIDRATSTLVSKAFIGAGTETNPCEAVLLSSGDQLVALWRDSGGSRNLYINSWQGTAWGAASSIDTAVRSFAFAPTADGFHLVWVTDDVGNRALAGRYMGATAQSTPYAFATVIPTTAAPTSAIAVAVSPHGELAVAWQATDVKVAEYYSDFTGKEAEVTVTAGSHTTGGLSIQSRQLSTIGAGAEVDIEWVIWNADASLVRVSSYASSTLRAGTTRQNSQMASQAFRVGDEVFVWLRSQNAGTHYLVSGLYLLPVAGYSDREEATPRTFQTNGNYAIPYVLPDPLDAYALTWARPFNQGTIPVGGVRTGDLQFLPALSVASFGRSLYLSGSAVKNWDGVTLADAGFQDWPLVSGTPSQQAIGGTQLTLTGTYQYRIYAVRYNAKGERFQSPAITYTAPQLTGSNNQFTIAISTVPSVSTDDVFFEVYRTQSTGTTFYLDGRVNNSLSAATVNYVSNMPDATLITQTADPHATGVGNLSELEELGPLGCSVLISARDRLWGLGGQVPAGVVQFSKLKESGEGAGFDDLAGFIEVNLGVDLTSIAQLNDGMVAFQRDKLHVISGIGPDNFGQGGFPAPELVIAGGASTHLGTTLTQAGLVYWGAEGPLLLSSGYQVTTICSPVRPLTRGLLPTGVRVDGPAMEVVWYTNSEDGDALLWNFAEGPSQVSYRLSNAGSRWARWTGLRVAGCSEDRLITSDGRLLEESDDAYGDDGVPFEFAVHTGSLRPEQILQDHTIVRRVGVDGEFLDDHTLRFQIYYNGSPLWGERFEWTPQTDTWLTNGDDLAALTPAQIDVLTTRDRSGGYSTHRRVGRQDCDYFSVRISDISSWRPTFTPFELTLELGAKGGLGRTPPATFSMPNGR